MTEVQALDYQVYGLPSSVLNETHSVFKTMAQKLQFILAIFLNSYRSDFRLDTVVKGEKWKSSVTYPK